MQEVDKEHKCRILEEAKKNIEKTEEKLREILKEKENSSKISAASEQKLLEYESIQKKHEILKIKTKTLDEKKADVEKIKKNIEELKKTEEELMRKKATLEEILKNTKDTEEAFLKLRQKLLMLQAAGKDEEIKLARVIEQKNLCEEIIAGIKRQIEVKEELKQKINRIKNIHNWMTASFENLMISMEKHVFSNIYYEFNSLVSKWFAMLIGDETITLSLDKEFTPILEQNGYETEVENLSGGEKTAVALSYRLALNKVINDLISNINTKDLIILDEPTDGFSSEQLDRVKEVIEELSLQQVIIVSHEQKIESFVENIIRIEKQAHESRVV
jgi:exonuclease SbcC